MNEDRNRIVKFELKTPMMMPTKIANKAAFAVNFLLVYSHFNMIAIEAKIEMSKLHVNAAIIGMPSTISFDILCGSRFL